jgi:Rps23 Pro-64 3,4-dihydroxylase Tpa1-like proline 4-hydroxylase
MTQQECKEKLTEISQHFNSKCKQSEISQDSNKSVVDTSVRKSSFINSSWKPLGNKLSKIFDNASKLVGQNLAGQQPIFIRYQHQGIVNSHWDFISSVDNLARRYTALIYMNDVPESSGGATSFDNVLEYKTNKRLKIQPKCGDLLLFRVSISHPFQKGAEILDYSHIHKGCEFVATPNCPEKWICQLFMLDLDHPKFSVSYLDRIGSFFNLSPKIKFH